MGGGMSKQTEGGQAWCLNTNEVGGKTKESKTYKNGDGEHKGDHKPTRTSQEDTSAEGSTLDELDEEEEEGRRIGPGSPSFRVYCENSPDEHQADDSHEEDYQMSNEWISDEDHEIKVPLADVKTNNKAKRERRSMHGRGKGKPSTVRNMFNVKECYMPSCTGSGFDHHHR